MNGHTRHRLPGFGCGSAARRSLCWWAAILLCVLSLAARAESVVVFNAIMYRAATNEAALEWIELHNQNAVDVDLSGWRFSDGIGFVFPNGTVVKGGGYLVVASEPATLMAQAGMSHVLGPFAGRLSNNGEAITLRDNNHRLMDRVDYGTDGEWPTGPNGSGVSLAKKHPNLASRPAESWTVSRQMAGTPGSPNVPLTGASGADLTSNVGDLRGDIVINEMMYHAPPIDPAPAVTNNVTLMPITGAWRYEDTGRDLGTAWRAREYDDSAWQTVTYRMVAGQNYGPTRWNEFRLGLLDEGLVLLDDVSVLRDPEGAQEELIQNGHFDTATGNPHWRFLGHHRGAFVPDPDNAANQVLRLSAADRAVMNHNHVETTFRNNASIVDGQHYEVSYRSRWVAGSPQVNTRASFSKLAKTTWLAMPKRLGTPAAPNSRRVVNAGPTFVGLQHSPVLPSSNQAVIISVHASDPDGVASVTVSYRVNPATTFRTLPVTLQSTGAWTASLPGQSAGKVVQFYVMARDARGAEALAPAKGPDARALYQVADAQGTTLPTHELRLIMLDADRDFMLQPTNVMSNARNGATLIYDRTEVFYDAGARLQGTAASRIRDGDDYVCYDIALPPGHLFRGVQNNIGIDRSGRVPTPRGQDEMCVFQMFHRAGLPIPYHDLCDFIALPCAIEAQFRPCLFNSSSIGMRPMPRDIMSPTTPSPCWLASPGRWT